MNRKKFIAFLLAVVLIVHFYNGYYVILIRAEQTTEYEQAAVAMIDNLDEYDFKAPLSWSCKLNSRKDGKIVSKHSSFTLKESSIIKMGIKCTETEEVVYTDADVFLYSNEAMTREKLEFGKYDHDPKTVYLPAGTYYIEVTDKKKKGYAHGIKVDVSVCVLPITKVLSVTSKPNKNNTKAIITVNQAFGADLECIEYVYGAYDEKDNMNKSIWKIPVFEGTSNCMKHIATELKSGNTFTVNKNGIYTIRVCTKDGTAYSLQYKVKGIGKIGSQGIKQKSKSRKSEKNTKTTATSFFDTSTGMDNKWGILFVTVFLLTGGMITFVFVYDFVHEKKTLYYEDLSKDYKEQFTQEYSFFKEYKEMQSETEKFRHDWKNHMLLLQEMLNQGEYEKAKRYFNNLSEKAVQNKQEIFTGNEILDLILVSKANKVDNNQIKLTCNGKLDTLTFMEHVDCCILFSNLIDSAIEANLKLRTGRYIAIEAHKKDQMLYVTISNPMKDMEEVIETRFQTTKKDVEKHGIGIRNIHGIFQKYHIEYYIIISERKFTIKMLFKSNDYD
ncbi:MAG: ATP-binding protein [Lachnospiraceae bacterium]|nr:ATP-binding protein [Lachnospiraceae bacterium]